MSEAEFWACTPRYFAARQKGYIENQRHEWERARFTGWLAVLPHVSSKKGGLKITDLYQFEWDEIKKPAAAKVMSQEEREALLKFQEDAKKIFEKQFGVKFEVASPAQETPLPAPPLKGRGDVEVA